MSRKKKKIRDTPARSVRVLVVHEAAAIITHSLLFINSAGIAQDSRCPGLSRTDEPEYEMAYESKTAGYLIPYPLPGPEQTFSFFGAPKCRPPISYLTNPAPFVLQTKTERRRGNQPVRLTTWIQLVQKPRNPVRGERRERRARLGFDAAPPENLHKSRINIRATKWLSQKG